MVLLVMIMRNKILKYERIQNLRIDRDLSQKYVANKLNIAQNTLSQYEAGLRNIPNEILILIAILYNTSVDYLLGLTDNSEPYERSKKCI